MRKKLLLSFSLALSAIGFAQPANDDCSGATTLTIDGGLTCGEDAASASLEGGECFTNYSGGSTESSMWYRITANNDSLVLNFIETNNPNCSPHVAIYGPFASGGGCNPACASQVYDALQSGDPGHHILLTGLTSGSDYLIQMQNNSCGGPGDGDVTFCIGVAQPSTNAQSSGATLIDECGTAFNETTDGGYWQSGTGTGFANLDGNAGTTCGGCIAGNDVSFVINNAAWNTFCSLTTGTWQITVDNVANCALTGAGVQAAVFTGTTGALVNEGQQSPIGVGGSWTSPTITVNSGDCAFLMLDGFAGDACDYSVTLTNISGGCVILPIEFLAFNVNRSETETFLNWEVKSESNNKKFIIEESLDGENFYQIGEVSSIGNHTGGHQYELALREQNKADKYYRLSAENNAGKTTVLSVKFVKGNIQNVGVEIFPNPIETSLQFLYGSLKHETIEVTIVDLNGQQLKRAEIEVFEGANYLELGVEGLDQGQYILKTTSDNQVRAERFIIK